ncbi:UNVERIFIED_CONTAM: hypothetical protein PYX00_000651 [Menopon gallinae]|uniref:Ionotropic glutamate receptor C-terminal domain-containing protein n=1 Tax=Menopon gallinae TaxID=328185 RepID=A0AAW2IAY7_9NEOP
MTACFCWFGWVQNNQIKLFDNCLLLFSSSFGTSVKTPGSSALRALFTVWIWYGLLTTTAYESSVKSKLTIPLPHKNVDTIQELLETDLELFGISNTIRVVMAGNENPEAKTLETRVKKTNSTVGEIVQMMLQSGNVGYLREETTFLYNAYLNRKAIGQIHRVRQCMYMYHPTLYLQKRCPVTHIVKLTLSRLLESGILLWWRSSFLRDSPPAKPILVQLSLQHMLATFVALFIGILISAIVFLLEMCVCNGLNLRGSHTTDGLPL